MNALLKGFIYCAIGSFVIPFLNGLYAALTTSTINWSALVAQALLIFIPSLVAFLGGVLHYPDGSIIYALPVGARAPPSDPPVSTPVSKPATVA